MPLFIFLLYVFARRHAKSSLKASTEILCISNHFHALAIVQANTAFYDNVKIAFKWVTFWPISYYYRQFIRNCQ
jgi:hypothetical protein